MTPWNNKPIKYAVFSAGSMGGLAFIGAWKHLEERGLSSGIIGFAGSSSGSIMATLASIGYSSEELERLGKYLKYEQLVNLQLFGLFENMGLETGDKIEELIRELIARKTGNGNITFRALERLTGRQLYITGSCLDEEKCYYFCAKDTPDMPVVRAIRISIALPWIFAAVKHEDKVYVDGGLYDPCPVSVFPRDETVALRVVNNTTVERDLHPFLHYSLTILFSMYRRLHRAHYAMIRDNYRFIEIDTGADSLSLDVSKKQRVAIIRAGYQQTKAIIMK